MHKKTYRQKHLHNTSKFICKFPRQHIYITTYSSNTSNWIVNIWDREICNFTSTENCDAKRLRPICRSSAHTGGLFLIWPRGCGGSGGCSFDRCSFDDRLKESGTVRRKSPSAITEPKAVPAPFCTQACVKQKSLQRPPTIRFTDFLFFELGIGARG